MLQRAAPACLESLGLIAAALLRKGLQGAQHLVAFMLLQRCARCFDSRLKHPWSVFTIVHSQ